MSPPRPSKSCSRTELKTQKFYKPGKVTRNPFLNFLRDYRCSNKGFTITEIASKGAEVWRSMNDQQKASYSAMAKQVPIRKTRRRGRRRRRGRSRRRGTRIYEKDYRRDSTDDDSMGEESGQEGNYSEDLRKKASPTASDQS